MLRPKRSGIYVVVGLLGREGVAEHGHFAALLLLGLAAPLFTSEHDPLIHVGHDRILDQRGENHHETESGAARGANEAVAATLWGTSLTRNSERRPVP